MHCCKSFFSSDSQTPHYETFQYQATTGRFHESVIMDLVEQRTLEVVLTGKIVRIKSALQNGYSRNIVENICDEAEQNWIKLAEYHENGLRLLCKVSNNNDDDVNALNSWFMDVENSYRQIEMLAKKYCYSMRVTGLTVRRNNREIEMKEIINRSELNDMDFSLTAVNELRNEVRNILRECAELNEQIVELSDSSDETGLHTVWLTEMCSLYSDWNSKLLARVKQVSDVRGGYDMIKLERVKLPIFSGNVREYARFKCDFQTLVLNNVHPSLLPYTLSSCLKQEASQLVANVSDDIEEMWKRLDRKYGDITTLVNFFI